MKDTFSEDGLKFFGTVSASISHEIKNRMAVINEQAGLLKDLVNMAAQGRDLSKERLMRLADSLKAQVSLTDTIIRNMNRFAHSVDNFIIDTDISELLSLIAALAKRTAGNRGIQIESKLPEPTILLETAPFFLMNLIWKCLDIMMLPGGTGRTVVVGCEKNENGVVIWFSTEGGGEVVEENLTVSVMRLAAAIQAEVVMKTGSGEIQIKLPYRMAASEK